MFNWAPCYEDVYRSGRISPQILNPCRLGRCEWVASSPAWKQWLPQTAHVVIRNRLSFVASCKAPISGLKFCHCQGNIMAVWNVASCSKGKECKVVPVHAMKAYWWRRVIAPLILNLGTIWRWVVSFALRPLNQRELSKRLGGSQNESGGFWKREKCCTFRDLNPVPSTQYLLSCSFVGTCFRFGGYCSKTWCQGVRFEPRKGLGSSDRIFVVFIFIPGKRSDTPYIKLRRFASVFFERHHSRAILQMLFPNQDSATHCFGFALEIVGCVVKITKHCKNTKCLSKCAADWLDLQCKLTYIAAIYNKCAWR